MMRRLLRNDLHLNSRKMRGAGFLQLLLIRLHGAAEIQRPEPFPVLQVQNAHIVRQRTGNLIRAGTSQAGPVALQAHRVRQGGDAALHAQRLQKLQHHADGAALSLRIGAVPGNSGGNGPHAAVPRFRPEVQSGFLRERFNPFRQLRAAGQQGPAFPGDDVGPLAGGHFEHLQPLRAFRESQFKMQHSLFRIDQREGSVGTEPDFRHLRMLRVIMHVFPVAFLVSAHDQPDAAPQGNSRFLQRLHGKHGRQGRPLVVVRSPAVDFPVLDFRAEGRLPPSVSHGNHVQMSQHAQHLRCIPQRRVAGVSVKGPHGKSQIRRRLHGQIHHPGNILSEGRSFRGLTLHGRHPHPFLQRGHKLVPIAFNQRVDSGIHLFLHSAAFRPRPGR